MQFNFLGLPSDKFDLSSEGTAPVEVSVDEGMVYHGVRPVLTSNEPPLRYAFGLSAGTIQPPQIIGHNRLFVRIKKADWTIDIAHASEVFAKATEIGCGS
jgi:hypothetical protein